MAYQFPNSPTTGDMANGYAWDGEKWISTSNPVSQNFDTRYVQKTGDTMTGGITVSYSSTNSVWLALSNTLSGAHQWSIASSGGGPSPIGSLLFYDNTSGGSLVTISGGTGHLSPVGNGTQNLGAAATRWGTVYTSDLDLSNGVGDWTIVEGEYDLFIYNNKRGKVYKFALTEVDPDTAPPKKD